MHAGTDDGGSNAGREIAVTDQADTGAGGANIGNQLFVAWAIEHDHDQIFHVAIHSPGNVFQVVGHGGIEVDGIFTGRPDHDFFHVAVGGIEQASTFGSGEDGDRSRRTGG